MGWAEYILIGYFFVYNLGDASISQNNFHTFFGRRLSVHPIHSVSATLRHIRACSMRSLCFTWYHQHCMWCCTSVSSARHWCVYIYSGRHSRGCDQSMPSLSISETRKHPFFNSRKPTTTTLQKKQSTVVQLCLFHKIHCRAQSAATTFTLLFRRAHLSDNF